MRASRWLTYRSTYTAVAAIAANSGSMWCDTGGAGTGLRSSTEGAPARTYMLKLFLYSMLFFISQILEKKNKREIFKNIMISISPAVLTTLYSFDY